MEIDGYDVIGDVHGHASKLLQLLTKMGYEERGGVWQHPTRTAIFVGDLIDRGPAQIETVRIARAMSDVGSAQIVIGNHEFNAIAWHHEHRAKSVKNRDQHREFLEQVGEGSALHDEMIDWFMTLPIWLDLGGLRIVHACWDQPSIDAIAASTGPNNSLTTHLLVTASQKGTPEWRAIETLLKGPEVKLAPNPSYMDKGGHARDAARWKWWNPNANSLREGAMIPPATSTIDGLEYPPLPKEALAELPALPYVDAVPVFYGHYWETGTPTPSGEHTACVDYSAGKGGPLVAYRWSGESALLAKNFIST